MDLKPIPAFYCCYLLRSTIRHGALYVGSTPNPVRRLAQHNGLSKGGAVRTSRDTLRPWEMVCIVSGFPSKIAALQFEWAWQNTHLTRHISAEERITVRHTNVRTSPRSGRTRRRPAKPRVSITDKLSNLHLLLRVDAFARLPLEVRFFSEDIYQVWLRWAERVQGNIRDGIRILLDMKRDEVPALADDPSAPPPSSQPRRPKKADTIGKGGIEGIDVSYNPVKAHVEKSLELLADHKDVSCAVCHAYVQKLERNMAVTCPHGDCNAVSHLTCLSKHFLAGEDENVLIPTEGTCPSCQLQVRWIEVVQELSLRSRGGTELAKLMKKPREKKLKEAKGAKKLVAAMDVDDDEGDDDDDEDVHDEDGSDGDQDDDETGTNAALKLDTSEDDWLYREPDDDEDVMSVRSTLSDMSMDLLESKRNGLTRSGVAQPTDRIEVVIEDSETEDMEILA